MSWPLFAVIQLAALTLGISVAFLVRNRALQQRYRTLSEGLDAASEAIAAAKLRMTDGAERVWLRDRLEALDDHSDVGAVQKVILANELEPSDTLATDLSECLSDNPIGRKILRSRWEPVRKRAHQVALDLIAKYPLSYPTLSQLHLAYGSFDQEVGMKSPTLPDPPEIPPGDSTDASQEAENLRATNELLQKELDQIRTHLESKLASGEEAEEQAEDLKTLLQQFTKDSRDMMACIQQLETENAALRQRLGDGRGESWSADEVSGSDGEPALRKEDAA